jgi:hypothetical protein
MTQVVDKLARNITHVYAVTLLAKKCISDAKPVEKFSNL